MEYNKKVKESGLSLSFNYIVTIKLHSNFPFTSKDITPSLSLNSPSKSAKSA